MRFFMLAVCGILAACDSGEKKSQPETHIAGSNMVQDETPISNAAASRPPAPAATDVTMPDFAPRYPGSTIEGVNSDAASGGNTQEVRLSTTDDADKIVAYYRERFAAAGLQKTSEFLSGGTGMLSAMGKGRTASIAITNEKGRKAIIVTYSGE